MADTLNIIFMGTPEFAVPMLDALVKAGHNIVAVYTQPPRPAGRGQKETPSSVHQYALSHNLKVHTPVTLKDNTVQTQFCEHKADVAVVAAYGLILPNPILEATPMGCVNVHPSLLPRWRGAAPIQRTIMAGDRETGVVIMQMDSGLDTGDMLMAQKYTIPDGTTAGQLHDSLAAIAAPLLTETLKGLKNGTITPVKQPEEGVTYAHKISKEECRIDWSRPAATILHKILGLAPQPGAYFLYKGEAIKVFDAMAYLQRTDKKPGTVLDGKLTIACGEGSIGNFMLRRPGKKTMSAEEMLKGYPIAKEENVA